METTPEDISLAVREVASYFPALSSCEADVIKFLSKKIRAYLKQQRHKAKKNTQGPNPEPTINAENESEQSDVGSNTKSILAGSVLSPKENVHDRNPPANPPNPSQIESGNNEQTLDVQSVMTAQNEPEKNTQDQNHEPMIHEQNGSLKLDGNIRPNDINTVAGSPRKRALQTDHYEFNESTPVLSTDQHSASKSKKAKMSSVSKKQPKTHAQAENVEPTQMAGKEFSSQNSQNVKFEVGHFVVLGQDIDEYEFCKIDDIVYHKGSKKYYMNITYYQLLDGRLEVYPEPGSDKPWTATKVPLNTVILNLRHTRLVDTDMKNEIIDITRDLYS